MLQSQVFQCCAKKLPHRIARFFKWRKSVLVTSTEALPVWTRAVLRMCAIAAMGKCNSKFASANLMVLTELFQALAGWWLHFNQNGPVWRYRNGCHYCPGGDAKGEKEAKEATKTAPKETVNVAKVKKLLFKRRFAAWPWILIWWTLSLMRATSRLFTTTSCLQEQNGQSLLLPVCYSSCACY